MIRHPLIPRGAVPASASVARGQAVVELALAMPLFLFLLVGVIDAARLVHAYNTVSQAAREGARLASVEAGYVGATPPCGAPVCPADPAQLHEHVLAAANAMAIGLGTLAAGDVSISCAEYYLPEPSPGCVEQSQPGNSVTVTVRFPFRPLTPLFAQAIPELTLSASATMTIG